MKARLLKALMLFCPAYYTVNIRATANMQTNSKQKNLFLIAANRICYIIRAKSFTLFDCLVYWSVEIDATVLQTLQAFSALSRKEFILLV